jgi:hypothetical protein
VEICNEKNISEQPFHRWERQCGMMEISKARRLKELEYGDHHCTQQFAVPVCADVCFRPQNLVYFLV